MDRVKSRLGDVKDSDLHCLLKAPSPSSSRGQFSPACDSNFDTPEIPQRRRFDRRFVHYQYLRRGTYVGPREEASWFLG